MNASAAHTMPNGRTFGARTTADEVVAGLDLAGRTIVVTGANTGIGEPTAAALAGAGAHVIFACRNRASGEAAIARTRAVHPAAKVELAELDLASFASIRRCADALQADKIDALVCNAGVSLMDYAETEDGFERVVGVCHIGHFLLARLMMPRLLAAGAARVVMVSSGSHAMPPKLDFANFPMQRAAFKGLTAYGQAKLCNLLMAKSLQRRYGSRGLTACALHPGTLIATEIGRHSRVVGALIWLLKPFTKTRAQGAATSVYGVVHEPASDIAGQYLIDCRVAKSSAESNDPAVAERVWSLSEEWVKKAGSVPAWP
jgi:WW domain-containing oxidoreductase